MKNTKRIFSLLLLVLLIPISFNFMACDFILNVNNNTQDTVDDTGNQNNNTEAENLQRANSTAASVRTDFVAVHCAADMDKLSNNNEHTMIYVLVNSKIYIFEIQGGVVNNVNNTDANLSSIDAIIDTLEAGDVYKLYQNAIIVVPANLASHIHFDSVEGLVVVEDTNNQNIEVASSIAANVRTDFIAVYCAADMDKLSNEDEHSMIYVTVNGTVYTFEIDGGVVNHVEDEEDPFDDLDDVVDNLEEGDVYKMYENAIIVIPANLATHIHFEYYVGGLHTAGQED